MNKSSFHRWWRLKASGLIYTVVAKEWMNLEGMSTYYVKIRFKHQVKPLNDWVCLRELRAAAEEVIE